MAAGSTKACCCSPWRHRRRLVFSVAMQMRSGIDHRTASAGFLFLVFGVYFAFFWTKGRPWP
jgi:hypothetical protein